MLMCPDRSSTATRLDPRSPIIGGLPTAPSHTAHAGSQHCPPDLKLPVSHLRVHACGVRPGARARARGGATIHVRPPRHGPHRGRLWLVGLQGDVSMTVFCALARDNALHIPHLRAFVASAASSFPASARFGSPRKPRRVPVALGGFTGIISGAESRCRNCFCS